VSGINANRIYLRI